MSSETRFAQFMAVAKEKAAARKPVTPQAFKLDKAPIVQLPSVIENDRLVTYGSADTTASVALSNMVFGDETAGKAYPGALIWADSLTQDARLDPTFTPRRTVPLQVTVSGAVMKDGTPTTYEYDGTFAGFAAAFATITKNIRRSEARVEVLRSDLSDSSAAMLEVGMSASGWGASMAASLKRNRESSRSSTLVSVAQAYFTLTVAPAANTLYFDKGMFKDEEFANQWTSQARERGELGVVRRVTYGRRLLLSITSSASRKELDVALGGRYRGVVKVDADFSEKERQTLASAQARLSVIGGKVDGVLLDNLTTRADDLLEAVSTYLGNTANMDDATSAAPIGFEAEYAYDRAAMLKFDAAHFAEQIKLFTQRNGGPLTFPPAEFKADLNHARVLAGDREIDTDDWTYTFVRYRLQVTPDRRGVRINILYDAREGNSNRTFGDTHFRIEKSMEVFRVPTGDQRTIDRIDAAASDERTNWHKGKSLFGPQPFPEFGALSNIFVTFDNKGRQDLDVMAITCTVQATVVMEHGPQEPPVPD